MNITTHNFISFCLVEKWFSLQMSIWCIQEAKYSSPMDPITRESNETIYRHSLFVYSISRVSLKAPGS